MNKINTAAFVLAFFLLLSCSKKDAKVVDPPPTVPLEEVVPLRIDSFTPKTGPEGTVVTISGSGFSTKPSENLLTLNGIPAKVLTASSTTLTITVPPTQTDKIMITRTGAKIASSADTFLYAYTSGTLAGSGVYGFADGPGETAQFKDAYGLVVDAGGNVFVADGSNNRIRKISPAGVVNTVAGSGAKGFADGAGAAAQFSYPHGIALDLYDNLYVADADNNLIRKITPAGVVSTLAGSGEKGYADGPGATAKFSFPMDLVVDPAGNVFVSDGDNRCIRKITPAGVVTTIGAQIFGVPEGIDMDIAGNIYVADTGKSNICKMTQAGVFTIIAGSGFGYEDGPALTARFRNPEGLAIDQAGNIYVGDLGNAAVRKITKAGEVSTVAGGTSGFAEGVGINSKFREPAGIDMDFFGNIYVADTRNSRIRKLR
jgi:sugar lactone lactonase YvrE